VKQAARRAAGLNETSLNKKKNSIYLEKIMTLERLVNCVLHRDIPQRPSDISAVRWEAMIKMAENRYRECVKNFLKKW